MGDWSVCASAREGEEGDAGRAVAVVRSERLAVAVPSWASQLRGQS